MAELTTDLGTYTAIDNDLYELVDDEWEPIDWDIAAEVPEIHQRLTNYLQQLTA